MLLYFNVFNTSWNSYTVSSPVIVRVAVSVSYLCSGLKLKNMTCLLVSGALVSVTSSTKSTSLSASNGFTILTCIYLSVALSISSRTAFCDTIEIEPCSS